MDELVKLTKSSLSITNCQIGSSQWVNVTHINNPHSFYVRPTACNSYLPDLQVLGNKLEATDAQVGAIIVYESQLLHINVRGQIVFVHDKAENLTCDIFAIDNGCLEKFVPLTNIYKPYNNVNIPALASHCRLVNCYPLGKTWDTEAIESLKFYVGTEIAQIIIKNKTPDYLIVELINSSGPPDISTILALTDVTALGSMDNAINRLSALCPDQNYFTFKKLNRGDVLHVRVQSGKSLNGFYVAQIDDYKQYAKDRDDMTNDCLNQVKCCPEDIKEGQMVCVKTDKFYKYERAVVKEITQPNKKVLVQLIDWGDEIETNFLNLKKVPQRFISKPTVAIYCTADERQVWDNGLQQFLYPGFEFLIAVKEIGDKFNIPNIVNINPLRKK